MIQPSRPLDSRVLYLWWTLAGGLALAAVAATMISILLMDLPPAAGAVVVIAVIGFAVALPPLRFRRWRYEIRPADILLSRGALFFVLTLIPFDRIQFVETRQDPLERLFRLNEVVLFTAAGRAGRIPGLDPSEAESIREELSKVAGAQTI